MQSAIKRYAKIKDSIGKKMIRGIRKMFSENRIRSFASYKSSSCKIQEMGWNKDGEETDLASMIIKLKAKPTKDILIFSLKDNAPALHTRRTPVAPMIV